MKASKNVLSLPVPRLEFNWSKNGKNWASRTCDYYLVLPIDEMDIRSNNDCSAGVFDEWRVSVGQTVVTGNDRKPIYEDGVVETPFRDGTHMAIDNKSLGGLPMFSVCGEAFTKITNK